MEIHWFLLVRADWSARRAELECAPSLSCTLGGGLESDPASKHFAQGPAKHCLSCDLTAVVETPAAAVLATECRRGGGSVE